MVVLNEFHFRLMKRFLDHVKANGGKTDCDDTFSVDGKFISSLSHGIQGTGGSAIEILGSLKALDAALCALSKTVKNSLSMVREELLPVTRHHGIYSLPLEVVSHIFQQVYVDDAKCATESIPLVNHYFREIAIGTPGLWTQLTTSQNPTLFIERSKCLGLDVNLAVGPHYKNFLKIASLYVERWASLSIPYYGYGGEQSWTCDVLAGRALTALKELRIAGREGYNGSLEDFHPLYSRWKMPSLQIIKSSNVLPSIQLASLTCWHVSVGTSDFSQRVTDMDLKPITVLLQSLASLTELSFDFGWFEKITFTAGTEAVLPNIKILRLKVKPYNYHERDPSLTRFLTSLHTHNLSELSVDVCSAGADQMTTWFAAIFPKGNTHWPPLDRLDLTMSYRSRDYGDIYDDSYHPDGTGTEAPDDLFERIPIVHHLSIRAVNVDPPDSRHLFIPDFDRDSPYSCHCYWNVQLPRLRTLRFQDCNKFDTVFIMGIENIFKSPEFETLKIHNCAEIDTAVVRKAMPMGKTLVSTVDWSKDISVL